MATSPVNDQTSLTPTVGELIIHFLKLEQVKFIFGIPGGGLMNLLVNLKENRNDVEYIVCRHESGAAYIADGYFRTTGKIGFVAVTTGPGATNALTGVMNAQADGSALIILTGEIDQKFSGMGYLQEGDGSGLNINSIFFAATGHSHVISSGLNAETILKQAFRVALSIPRQAVHLSLPVNVTLENTITANLPTKTSSYRTNPTGAPIQEVQKAMASILACKRPLLFIGNGCRQSLRDTVTYHNLILFVEKYGIPVITTPDGKGLFPEDHELSLRVYGMADCMWPSYYLTSPITPYDGLLILGSALGELSTNTWLPVLIPKVQDAPFIQVDILPKIIGRSFEVSQGIIGEVGAFINDLVSLMPQFPPDEKSISERKMEIAGIKSTYSPFFDPTNSYSSKSSPIEPAALMASLQKTMPEKTKLFIDAGNCVGWSIHFLSISKPSSIYSSLSMGPMGFGVCSVIGGKLGSPDFTCIALVGDSAFLMFGAEVSTASQHKIGAIWIVLFDNNLNMVSQGMEYFKPDSQNPDVWEDLYQIGNPDIKKYAESLGAEAYTLHSPDEFENIMPHVLSRANQDHIPQVIIVGINRKSLPPYYNATYGPKKPNKHF